MRRGCNVLGRSTLLFLPLKVPVIALAREPLSGEEARADDVADRERDLHLGSGKVPDEPCGLSPALLILDQLVGASLLNHVADLAAVHCHVRAFRAQAKPVIRFGKLNAVELI